MADEKPSTPSSKAVQMTVLYENSPTATFDLAYYLDTHMRLMREKWTAYGLIGYTISRNVADVSTNAAAPYSMSAILTWESEEKLKIALASDEAPKVFADIPNFSSVMPVLVTGSVIETWGRME